MAVVYDAFSESHTGTTGSSSESSFSWTHTPVGTPRGVIVFVVNLDNATGITQGVTYGGVAMQDTGLAAADTAGEAGRCSCWFLGSGIPTGPQTITVTRTNNTNVMYAVAATVTAGGDTEVYTPGAVLLQNDGTLAVQSVDDGSPATGASVRFAAGMSGLASPPGVGTGSTSLASIDAGAQGAAFCRETTAGNGARNVGFSSGTSDDRAFIHVAVRQAVTPTQTSVARVSLAPGGLPNPQTTHSLHVRARKTSGTGTVTLRAALYEGATNRSGDLESFALTTSLAEYTLSISDTAAATITDYTNLEVRFWGYSVTGDSTSVEVADVWLETPAGGNVFTQAINDTLTVADSTARQNGLARTVADTAAVADNTSLQGALQRAVADTLAVADSTALQRAIVTSFADTVAVADAVTQQSGRSATLADTLAVGDVVSSVSALGLGLGDSIGVVDVQNTLSNVARVLADALSVADVSRTDVTKLLADALVVADTLANAATTTLADTIPVTDNTAAAIITAVALADVIGIADAQSALNNVARVLADTLTVADATTADVTRLLADALGVADAQARGMTTVLADSVPVTDHAAAAIIIAATLADALTIADALTVSTGKGASINDALTVADSLTRAVSTTRTVADVLTVADQAALAAQYARTLSDALSTADQALPAAGVYATVADALGVADAALAARSTAVALADLLDLNDELDTLYQQILEGPNVSLVRQRDQALIELTLYDNWLMSVEVTDQSLLILDTRARGET